MATHQVSLQVSTGASAEAQALQTTSFRSEATGATSAEGISSEYRQVWFRLPNSAVPHVPPGPYAGNYIRTAKYTFYNFLVINLFEQFTRIANLYFLLIAVLQLVPGLSPTHWFTTVAPLLFVLLVNAVKEIYDDYYRHRSDDEVNNRTVDVLMRDGVWRKVRWKDIQVGDLVKIVRDAEVPADTVFLSSSDHESLCYMETANLDGETNLKLKYSYGRPSADTMDHLQDSEMLAGKFIECELPNEKLYQFEGSMVDGNGAREGLDISNLVLRGCTLRKTDWIVGVVVFAGVDTKIQCNQSSAPRKVTQLESHMNFLVVMVFFIQVVLAIAGALGRGVWLGKHSGDYYLESVKGWPELGRGFGGGIVTVLRFIILLNQLIPISLYVTLEVVKVVQCLFLNWDREMYSKSEDTPFVCRTTTLNEDLGQVQYVLSDKTGTLTQNVMGFVRASIGGRLYGMPEADSMRARHNSAGIPSNTPHSIAFDANLRQIVQRLPGSEPVELKAQDVVDDFLLNLAICNTVVPTRSADGELQYQAESPDEEALVQGAAYLGYQLISRSTEKVEIQIQEGEVLEYTVLALLEFNSIRKRMSILCRCPDGKIKLFCKGADMVVLQRLASSQPFLTGTNVHLSQMASNGFRTLCIAQKNIPEAFYQEWQHEFHLASVSLDNRESRVAKMAEMIEEGLTLVGATAVEDKLQEGVPEAIASLSKAGIKVWVLTGDKLETAIVISRSCNLITDEMEVVEIRESDVQSTRKTRSLRRKGLEIKEKSTAGVGLVIEGGALAVALEPRLQERFLDMCKLCKAVVCCRVSPIQKAQVANLVKQKAGAMTLGIGDGANDVSMIQAAHIGVGISGREGRAAVLASDFAMCQFSFLARLLLVHGRWSYKRNSEVVLYAFYKNFAYCLANVYLNFCCTGFSSQPIYGPALIATYNLFWTSLPTIAFAIFEQDITAETALAAPQLYQETMKESSRTFFCSLGRWLLEAVWHSLLTFWLPIFALTSVNKDGRLVGLHAVGVAIYTAVILTVNLKVAVRTQHWTMVNALTIFVISIGMWFPFVYLCSRVWEWYGFLDDMSGVAIMLFSSPSFWLSSVLGAPIISILLDLMLVSFSNRFLPRDSRIYQEKEKYNIESADVRSFATVTQSEVSCQLQDMRSSRTP